MLFNHWAERLNLVYHALFSNLCSRMLWLVDAYFTQKLCSFTNVLLAVFSSVLIHHLCLFTKLVILNPRDATTTNIVGLKNVGSFWIVLAEVCKRTQQLPMMLGLAVHYSIIRIRATIL